MRTQAKAPGGAEQLKERRDMKRRQARARARQGMEPLWWQETDPAKSAELANQSITQWLTMDQRRIYDLGYYARLYGTAQLGFSGVLSPPQGGLRSIRTRTGVVNPLAATFNGCQSVVDTITNTVTKGKPVVQFVATGGDWNSHRIAKMRNRFVAGWFYEQDVYQKTATAFRDSGVWGDGVLHVYAKDGRAVCERVFPGDLFVNQASCITNNRPLEMGRVRLIDRHEAFMLFEDDPEAQRAIMEADQEKLAVDSLLYVSDDMIRLNEMWRLPSHPGADDGWHIISTKTAVVSRTQWKHESFPFVFIRCSPRLFGYWSQGLVEQLQNLQLQYNDLSYSINEAIELAGRFKLFVNSASNVVVESITNGIGEIIRGDGPPQSLLWQAVQPEVYARLEKLERMFFTQSGVAQMVATPDPEKSDPREAAIAILAKVEIYDERHAVWNQSYQDAHLELARQLIRTVQDIRESEANGESKPYEVYSIDGPQAEPIDFGKLKFEKDEQFVITCMPVNQLPDKIEGRIALAHEFVQNGWYDEATARSVFLFPDVQRVETLFNASHEYFSKVLDAAIEKGEEIPDPEVTDNLQLALKMALQHLAYAKNRGVSEARCDLIRGWIIKLKQRLDENAAQMAAMAGPAGAPLANPAPPPTSDLLPNPNAQQAA